MPAIISGPRVSPGTLFTPVTSMVDLGPTILELAAGGNDAGAVPASMDGMSFAPMLTGQAARPWKGAALVEYLSIRDEPTEVLSSMVCGGGGDGADAAEVDGDGEGAIAAEVEGNGLLDGLLEPSSRDAIIDAYVLSPRREGDERRRVWMGWEKE